MYSFGYQFQAFGAMINSVHAGHNSQQCLRGTDVRGGFVPADMLLAGLQSHTQGIIASAVDSNTDYAAGNRTFVFFLSCKKSSMRAAEAHRYAKTLAVT